MFGLFGNKDKEKIQSWSEPDKSFFFLGRFDREHIKDFCSKYDTIKNMSDEELFEKYWDAPRLIEYKNDLKEPTFKFIESIKRGDWEIERIYSPNQIVFKNGKEKRIILILESQLITFGNEMKLKLSVVERELIYFAALNFITAEDKKNEEQNRKFFSEYMNI